MTLLGDLSLVLSVAGREPQHGETTKAVACSFLALRPGRGGGAASPSAELAGGVSVREATKVPPPLPQDVANILGPGHFQMALFWAPPRPQDVGNILGTRRPQIQDPRDHNLNNFWTKVGRNYA